MSHQETILSIKNLEKMYPNGVRALKGISFEVKKGEFVVIIGLSGSGKSTLLRCLNRLHDATSGEIHFKNKNILDCKSSEVRQNRKKMAMIFQHFNLIERQSALNNVLTGNLYSTNTVSSILGLFKEEQKLAALNYLDLVGIKEKAHCRVDQLSGGQKQRVAIARALAQNPEILLADEPVSALDPATCHTVMDYLEKINKELGITVICNLHFLSLVRRYATRVIALKDGAIIYDGDPKNIDEAWFETIYGEGAKEVHIT